ncbi:hypothetical protein H0H93_005914, partial [Arthromyces matolae]
YACLAALSPTAAQVMPNPTAWSTPPGTPIATAAAAPVYQNQPQNFQPQTQTQQQHPIPPVPPQYPFAQGHQQQWEGRGGFRGGFRGGYGGYGGGGRGGYGGGWGNVRGGYGG